MRLFCDGSHGAIISPALLSTNGIGFCRRQVQAIKTHLACRRICASNKNESRDYISFEHPELLPLVKYFPPQEDLSRLWIHYFICLYSEHGREDPSRLWHETESGYMVTSFDSINIEVLDKVHICSIPTIAMLEMWEKLGQWV